jgi:hypothetical protein
MPRLRFHEKLTGPSPETEKPIGWRHYVQFDYALRKLPRKMSQRAPGVTSSQGQSLAPRDLNLGPTVVIRKAILLIRLASCCVIDQLSRANCGLRQRTPLPYMKHQNTQQTLRIREIACPPQRPALPPRGQKRAQHRPIIDWRVFPLPHHTHNICANRTSVNR